MRKLQIIWLYPSADKPQVVEINKDFKSIIKELEKQYNDQIIGFNLIMQ